MLRDFLERGEEGRSLVLFLGLPEARHRRGRGEGHGFLLGYGADEASPAALELEDVAPSLLVAMGLPEPAGAVGTPHLEVLLPRDPTGSAGALLAAYPEAHRRNLQLMEQLGFPPPARSDRLDASALLRKGDPRAARDLLLRERIRLQDGPLRAARAPIEAWARGGRDQAFWALYCMMLLAGLATVLGVLLGMGRGGALGGLLGVGTGVLAVLILGLWIQTDPDRFWVAFCRQPWRRLLLAAHTALAAAAPTLILAIAGRARAGACASAYLVQLGPAVLGLGAMAHLEGPLVFAPLQDGGALLARVWVGGYLLVAPLVFLLGEGLLAVLSWSRREQETPSGSS